MGIYIKDFKMPEGGYRTIEIAYDVDGHPMAIADGGDVFDVIPISPHGRLVDADELRNDWLENGVNAYVYDTNSFLTSLDYAPTVIPAESSEV